MIWKIGFGYVVLVFIVDLSGVLYFLYLGNMYSFILNLFWLFVCIIFLILMWILKD